MEYNSFTHLFLSFSLLFLMVTLWLNRRQAQAVSQSFSSVPKQFSEKISLESHQKSANYTQAKLKFATKETLLSMAILLLWTLAGGLEWLDTLWRSSIDSSLWRGVAFILSFLLISSLIDLPMSLAKTFGLEKIFGFNKVTPRLFIQDSLKGLFLTFLFGIPLSLLVLYLMSITGVFWWVWVWGVLVSISLLALWLYPTYIAPLFNKFKPLEDKELNEKITTLLTQAGFSSDGIFVMDGSKRSSHGNAYFTGIGKQKRIVFFDTLLKGLSHNEVLAVLGHELGHFHHKHIRTQMMRSFSVMLVSLAMLGYLISQPWFYQGLGVSQPSDYMALILFLLIMPVFTFFISPISNQLSRKHEYEADAFAVTQTNADDLISALVGLYRDNASTLTPDKLYSLFYDSHPNASLRVNHLQGVKK